jgi:hypothetical protein
MVAGLMAFSPRFTAGIALAASLVLAPTALPGGGDKAEARTVSQCMDRYFACTNRCGKAAIDKYGEVKRGTAEAKANENCINRTCEHQKTNCVANATDAKKPAKAVAEPSGAGPKTKVQPKWQPGKVSVPDRAVPVTRVPTRVQPMGGIQSSPGSGGPVLRRNR